MEPGYEIYEYSRRGLLKDLRESLQNGIKPDEYMAYDGSTALVIAARSGHDRIVEELIAAGADVSIRTDDGSTMLHHAVSGQSPAVVRALLAAGVGADECNEDGISPLILAAYYSQTDIAVALLEAGADVHLRAEGWGNALDSAQGDAVTELLES